MRGGLCTDVKKTLIIIVSNLDEKISKVNIKSNETGVSEKERNRETETETERERDRKRER